MATTAKIGFYNKQTEQITFVYCIYDGQPSYMGRTLATHYGDEKQVQKLIDFGNFCFLEQDYEKLLEQDSERKYKFDKLTNPPVTFDEFKRQKSDYTYLYFNDVWHLILGDLTDLSNALKIDKNALQSLNIFKNKLFYFGEPNGFNICEVYCISQIPPIVNAVFKNSTEKIQESLPYQYLEDLPPDLTIDDYLIQVKEQFKQLNENCLKFMDEIGLKIL